MSVWAVPPFLVMRRMRNRQPIGLRSTISGGATLLIEGTRCQTEGAI